MCRNENALPAMRLPFSAFERVDRAENCPQISETDTFTIARIMQRTQKHAGTPQRETLIMARIDRQAKNTPGWVIKKRRKLHAAMIKEVCYNRNRSEGYKT